MALKKRETVRSGRMGMFTMILILIVLIAYFIFYNQVVTQMEASQQLMVTIIAMVMMIIVLLLVVRFISTTYELVLTHKGLTISRRRMFMTKEVAMIYAADFVSVMPAENFKGTNGRVQKFTLAQIEGMNQYALLYKDGNKVNCVMLQCSVKMYRELEAMVEQTKRAVSGNAKSKKKKKK